MKNLKRDQLGLKVITENTLEILSKMTPATPPPNPVDLANEIQNAANNLSIKKNKKVRLKIDIACRKSLLNSKFLLNLTIEYH
jgi:hypothetical protein